MKLESYQDLFAIQQVRYYSVNNYRLIEVIQDSALGRKVCDSIIPAVVHLRQLYPLKMDMIFPATFLNTQSWITELDCTNLAQTDEFFDSFVYQ